MNFEEIAIFANDAFVALVVLLLCLGTVMICCRSIPLGMRLTTAVIVLALTGVMTSPSFLAPDNSTLLFSTLIRLGCTVTLLLLLNLVDRLWISQSMGLSPDEGEETLDGNRTITLPPASGTQYPRPVAAYRLRAVRRSAMGATA